MDEPRRFDHMERTRYVRPVDAITFSAQELLTSLFSAIHPSNIVSINVLHGDRRGVTRVSFKNNDALREFESKIAGRAMHLNGSRLALVGESGRFIKVTLFDVPEYINSADLENVLKDYGTVANVRREYVEYRGHKIENEIRTVFFTCIDRDLPSRVKVDGNDIYVGVKSAKPRSEPQDYDHDHRRGSVSGARMSNDINGSHSYDRSGRGTSRRAHSPLVTPETERPPVVFSSDRPRYRMPTPEPVRRSTHHASARRPSMPATSTTTTSNSHGVQVGTQVTPDDLKRQFEDMAATTSGWSANYVTPMTFRKCFENNVQVHSVVDNDRKRNRDDTKI